MSEQLSIALGAQLIQAHSTGLTHESFVSSIGVFIATLETLSYNDEDILGYLKNTKEMMYIETISKALDDVIHEY